MTKTDAPIQPLLEELSQSARRGRRQEFLQALAQAEQEYARLWQQTADAALTPEEEPAEQRQEAMRRALCRHLQELSREQPWLRQLFSDALWQRIRDFDPEREFYSEFTPALRQQFQELIPAVGQALATLPAAPLPKVPTLLPALCRRRVLVTLKSLHAGWHHPLADALTLTDALPAGHGVTLPLPHGRRSRVLFHPSGTPEDLAVLLHEGAHALATALAPPLPLGGLLFFLPCPQLAESQALALQAQCGPYLAHLYGFGASVHRRALPRMLVHQLALGLCYDRYALAAPAKADLVLWMTCAKECGLTGPLSGPAGLERLLALPCLDMAFSYVIGSVAALTLLELGEALPQLERLLSADPMLGLDAAWRALSLPPLTPAHAAGLLERLTP